MKRTDKNIKRILSLVMVVLVLLASLPFAYVNAIETPDNAQQIEYKGGWNPSQYPTDGTLYKDRIAVNKTIVPTEHENYFDVTLNIVAKPRVIDQSVDAVVVMDVSNTMNSTHQGLGPNNAGYDIKDARLSHAKAAVKNFLDLYSADEKISEDRQFGLVTFNSYANTVVPLTAVNTAQKTDEIKAKVDAITAPTDNRVRFTNIEGGLQLAYNLLKDSEAAFRYIVLLTDGLPTTYIESERDSTTQIVGYDTYMTGDYNEDKAGTDGYFADSISGKLCTDGVNYSDKAADRADDVAKNIKDAGINIFSIGVDVEAQSIPTYLNLADNTVFTTVDRTSANHVIGDTSDSYKLWLSDEIAGGIMIEKASKTEAIHRYSSGNSSAELTVAFTNILKDIEVIPSKTLEEAYTLDSMSDYVDFMYFYDLQGNPTERLTNTRHGRDVAVFDKENKTIKWWLTTTQSFYIDDIGNYVLSVKYRVRLKNESEGFDASKALEMGGKTTFYFKTTDSGTGKPLYGDNSIDFPVPKIEGYTGKLIFIKKDASTGNPLEGAEFTLKHYAASCDRCEGDADIAEMTAESNRRGQVEFEGIPSGHEYVLIETKAPDGYKTGAHHSVNVAYGKTYLDSNLVTEDAPGVVNNYNIEPVEVQIKAEKNLIGRDIVADEFHFSLTGVFEFGNRFHEIQACDENGQVAFHAIRFDQEGTYNFRLTEIKGTDESVIYDAKEYNIEIKIGLSEDGGAYTVETTIDGVDVENDTEPDPFLFTSTLRESGKANIKAENTLDDKCPEDGIFRFKLTDDNGNIIQTKSTVNGEVIFDEIEYTQEGVYRYIITEDHIDELFDGIFFDHSVYSAVVTVTTPEDNSAFVAEVEYFFEGSETEVPVFRNLTREEGTLKLNFVKSLDGLAPIKDRFAFEVRDAFGEVVEVVKNAEQGVISLSALTFDEVGYFTYTVHEVIGDEENIIYDKTIYKIYVTVEPHHNVSNYYLEVDIKKSSGEEDVLVDHAHGINIRIISNESLAFVNTTGTEPPAEEPTNEPTESMPSTPVTTQTTLPEAATDATSRTDASLSQNSPDTPKTGADNTLIWVALIFVTGAGIGVVARTRRKEE